MAGASTASRLWDDALQLFGINSPSLARDFAAYYSELRATTALAFEDSAPVLEALRADGYRLAVITNGPGDIQRHKLAIAGLDSYFDAVIASTDVGAGKPDRIVFEAALEATGAEAASTWHIGDNLSTDVGGALDAGLKAAWLNRSGEVRGAEHPAPDAELTTLESCCRFWALGCFRRDRELRPGRTVPSRAARPRSPR